MTEREIEAFEKQLKAVPLAPLSDAFFANVAKRLAEEPEDAETASSEAGFDDLADVEAALRRLQPIAPSEAFFAEVGRELSGSGETIVFPKKRTSGILMRFPRRILAMATTAAAACAVAVGVHFSGLGSGFVFPQYELVSSQKELCNVEELPLEMRDDGTLVRPVRYIYADTKRWRDPHTQNSFIEYHPFEETVPTVVAVY